MNEMIEMGKIVIDENVHKDKSPFDAEFWFRE